jgi:agmatinase
MIENRAEAHSDMLTSGGVISFLGAPHVPVEELARRNVHAAFLGYPFEGGNQAVERPGSANGPHAVRIASTMSGPWSFDWDVDLFDRMGLVDCGDTPVIVGDLNRTHELVQQAVEAILEAGAIPIAVGGDHSLVVPGARALSSYLGAGRKMGYLQIDAHLDAADEIAGETQTNCSGLVRATELPNVDVANVAIIGIRGQINVREWWEEARRRDIRVYPMSEVRDRGFDTTVDEALDRVWAGVDGVYVSFDTDSIDAAFAPGTTGPEPAGFTSTEILELARRVGTRGLSAVDNVELCSVYDPAGVTAKLVWSVLAEMLFAHAKHHL